MIAPSSLLNMKDYAFIVSVKPSYRETIKENKEIKVQKNIKKNPA